MKCNMWCKPTHEDKGRVKFLKGKKHDKCIETKPYSCSNMFGFRCKENLVEFLCSCCMLCVCCPLSVICCSIKVPFRICEKAMRGAWNWTCYGSKSRVFAEYSSFSDIDLDVTSGFMSSASHDKRDRFLHLICE
ncbi:hypothetical protein Lalb_Chr07g0187771 [Lupinus albus]|uniref:Uncharacterized protein n=1 Tax=Lupinus albus TaxID=3870 RepID=A0A6A4Q9B7_LUPAL|nr:hypothetical protein Lalb_Chr07g0187771 [Lupinus albus]